MPLVRISMLAGRSPEDKRAIRRGIYEALRETFEVPENDRFILNQDFAPDDLEYDPTFLGMARTDGFVAIEITVSDTRRAAQKADLFRRIVDKLEADPGVRPDDVMIVLTEVRRENWSFGRGIAQYWEADKASVQVASDH